ncbi:MAG: hypothetical protein WA869_36890, partial [Alloacidobacterium sp.]
ACAEVRRVSSIVVAVRKPELLHGFEPELPSYLFSVRSNYRRLVNYHFFTEGWPTFHLICMV